MTISQSFLSPCLFRWRCRVVGSWWTFSLVVVLSFLLFVGKLKNFEFSASINVNLLGILFIFATFYTINTSNYFDLRIFYDDFMIFSNGQKKKPHNQNKQHTTTANGGQNKEEEAWRQLLQGKPMHKYIDGH